MLKIRESFKTTLTKPKSEKTRGFGGRVLKETLRKAFRSLE